MIDFDVAPGVHLITHAYTNCFVVEGEEGVTLVDAGYPATWPRVARCLAQLGRSVDDVRGLVLTHGHFDHLGFARHLQQRYAVEVWGHPGDRPIFAHPYRYRPERPRLLYPLAYPRGAVVLGTMTGAGALGVPGLVVDRALESGPLELPGRPYAIHTPGHTDGECVLLLADRGALLTGDALVTLDPYTGLRGPRVVARAATHNSCQALDALLPLRELDVNRVLPGHGRLWPHGIGAAVDAARSRVVR